MLSAPQSFSYLRPSDFRLHSSQRFDLIKAEPAGIIGDV